MIGRAMFLARLPRLPSWRLLIKDSGVKAGRAHKERRRVVVVVKIVVFLLWVNILPPLANLIWRDRFANPVDGGLSWFDHRPLFGPNKTIRGIMVSALGGIVVSPLLGIAWRLAGSAALLAMAGDLLSSFIKRRLQIPSGKTVIGLDQLFESLFPAMLLSSFMPLTAAQLIGILFVFLPGAYLGSSFWNYITYRPPQKNYPRLIRSPVRFREWRSCHIPLFRWQVMLNLTSFLSHQFFLTGIFKITGLYEKGVRNTLLVQVEEHTFHFETLPASFDRFRILLLTDLHLDGVENLTEMLIERLKGIEVDLCLIGGDIRMRTYGPIAPCLRQLRRLLPHIKARHGVLGVLGNHDCIEMAPDFEECGIIMLINDSWEIILNGQRIWIVGVDDPHYYKTDNATQALQRVPQNDFKIFLAHSPEAYQAAAAGNTQLYLCGHTHGGQICLPGRKPVFTNSSAPRYTATGSWKYQKMSGYTSRGAGASGVPLRFNCPGEICLITLRQGSA
jgi:hypothetical protein